MVTGIICICLVFIVEKLGGILPLSIALGGVALGPTMGMFSLGMLVPRTNSKVTIYKLKMNVFRSVFMFMQGAFWGAVVSLIAMTYIIFTAQYYRMIGVIRHEPKPVSTEECTGSISYNSTK